MEVVWQHWKRHIGESPGEFRIVFPKAIDITVAEELADAYDFVPMPEIETIDNIGELARIGLAFRDVLASGDDADRQTVACFHSIDAIREP